MPSLPRQLQCHTVISCLLSAHPTALPTVWAANVTFKNIFNTLFCFVYLDEVIGILACRLQPVHPTFLEPSMSTSRRHAEQQDTTSAEVYREKDWYRI